MCHPEPSGACPRGAQATKGRIFTILIEDSLSGHRGSFAEFTLNAVEGLRMTIPYIQNAYVNFTRIARSCDSGSSGTMRSRSVFK